MTLEIKIFSGQQSGASLPISDGDILTLGNSFDNDIFLDDDPGFTFQYQIKLIDNLLTIDDIGDVSSQDAVIKINNGDELQFGYEYSLPLFFMINGIKIGIGEDLVMWDFMNNDPDSVVSNELDGQKFISDIADFEQESLNNRENQKGIFRYCKAGSIKIIKKFGIIFYNIKDFFIDMHANYAIKFYIALAIIFILFVGGSSAYAYLNQFNKQNLIRTNYTKAQLGIKRSFSLLPNKYANLVMHQNNGVYQIMGVVINLSEETEIRSYFKDYNNYVKFDLIYNKDALEKIKNVLASYNFTNLNVRFDNEMHQFSINGITPEDNDKINQLQIQIYNSIPELTNIDFNIYTETQVNEDIKASLGELSNYITITSNCAFNQITLSGYLTQLQINALDDCIRKLQQKYHNILIINQNIKDVLHALPFKIFATYTGDQPYIVTDSNIIVYIGGQVGGFTLIAITSDKIVLRGEKLTLEIPLSQIMN